MQPTENTTETPVQTGPLKARQLTLAEMPALAEARDDVLAAAQIYAPRGTDISALTNERIMDLVEEGDRINDPLYLRWIKRGEKLAMEQGIDLSAARRAVAEKIAKLSGGPDSGSA